MYARQSFCECHSGDDFQQQQIISDPSLLGRWGRGSKLTDIQVKQYAEAHHPVNEASTNQVGWSMLLLLVAEKGLALEASVNLIFRGSC